MKKLITLSLWLISMPFMIISQEVELFIEWDGENEIANAFVNHGIGHMVNIEYGKAMGMFEAALKEDPSLFAPHVAIALLTGGDKAQKHTEKAKELVKGKNEVSQLYASLLDIPKGVEGNKERADIWAKMNKIASPNANFIQLNYAISRPDQEEGLEELLKLRAEMDRLKREAGFIDNILGYMYAETGDLDNAKAHFDKYLEKYPDGYNAYDSMAEYYMMAKEYENSVAYYKKVLEMYPGSQNAIDKLAELKGLMSKDGDLFLITQETVNPEHMGDYWKWGTEYKTVADQTNFQTFWVSSSGGTFSYAANVGKTYEDMEAYEKKWEDWAESTPAIQEQFEKYQHTVANTQKALWRHLPELSYAPKGFSFEKAPTYARVHYAYAKYGKEDEMETILKEFVDMWKEKGITRPFRVFMNVFGEDADCIAIRSLYEDVSAWKAEEKEVMEKVGKETLMEMRMKWMDNLRKFEEKEQFLHEELTHIKSPEVASVE